MGYSFREKNELKRMSNDDYIEMNYTSKICSISRKFTTITLGRGIDCEDGFNLISPAMKDRTTIYFT